MRLIETKTLTVAAASIEFTAIPQDGTDLVVLVSARSARTADVVDFIGLSFNGSTASRTGRDLRGNGSAASSNTHTDGNIANVSSATSTANTFGNTSIYIPNYTSSANKSASSDAVMENNATTSYQAIHAHLWSNTAAITSVTLTMILSTFAAGSTASLYKVTKGSDGIVTVS
jgi:hypothetical protein